MKKQVILEEEDIRAAVEVYLIHKGIVKTRGQVGDASIRTGVKWTIEVTYEDSPLPPPPPKPPPPEPPKTWHERLDQDDPKKPV